MCLCRQTVVCSQGIQHWYVDIYMDTLAIYTCIHWYTWIFSGLRIARAASCYLNHSRFSLEAVQNSYQIINLSSILVYSNPSYEAFIPSTTKIMIKMRPAILLLVVALVLCLPELSQGIMGYQNISSSRAICNDFSRAGMFVKKILAGSPSSKKWIIFLESGGFCYSAESCNRRFFQSHIRSEAEGGDGNSNLLQSDFDPYNAWMKHKGGDLSRVISPLMTSMDRFRNTVTRHRGQFVIDGTDILSANCRDNPDFCDHNSVVLPYCSSDLWLGNDFRNFTTKGQF